MLVQDHHGSIYSPVGCGGVPPLARARWLVRGFALFFGAFGSILLGEIKGRIRITAEDGMERGPSLRGAYPIFTIYYITNKN
ncbi:MAG: hypothetical protein GYA51_17985 [Candidatus Methanofastidiosa archaeon]|nr:hypothetical protein [Candidatus Methanofastidiosa archaeon]